MVFVTGIRQNTNHMFGGVDDASWTGFPLFVLAMAIMTLRLARRLAFHHPVRSSGAARRRVHGRLAHGAGRGMGPALPAHQEGHLALLLAERHDAELQRVR